MDVGTSARLLDVDESGDVIVASPCLLISVIAHNTHATDKRYLRLYNKATAPDENDTPIMTVLLSASDTDQYGIPGGMRAFSAGLSVRATTAAADNDTGAPGLNEVGVTVFYRVLSS